MTETSSSSSNKEVIDTRFVYKFTLFKSASSFNKETTDDRDKVNTFHFL